MIPLEKVKLIVRTYEILEEVVELVEKKSKELASN